MPCAHNLPFLRALSAGQGLYDPQNPHRLRNSRGEKPPMDALPALPPGLCMAITVLDGICPDRATPELMELSARLGSMVPYRKAAELLAEFLPIESTEGHVTVRKRTLRVGSRL